MTLTSLSVRNSLRPSMPPKPPTRVGPGTGRGDFVRPANELHRSTPSSINRVANCRAFVVPPRMRTSMSPSNQPVEQ